MREVMAAVRPYGEFYDFYSVSPGYFGYTFVLKGAQLKSKLHHSGTLNVSSMNARPPVLSPVRILPLTYECIFVPARKEFEKWYGFTFTLVSVKNNKSETA
jgi:hypothetical protein